MTDRHGDTWPILVLSLSDAEVRQAKIGAALEARGLDFAFFDAVDGRNGLTPEHEAEIDRNATPAAFGREMSDTEYACALSHMAMYRHLLEIGAPGAIILEDDAILTPLFDDFLAAQGYLKGDLVQMDHLHGDIWRFETPLRLTSEIMLAPAARNASLTTGYSISARGARHFLDTGLPLCRTADWPSDPTALGALLCLPRVVDHPPFDTGSYIEAERTELRGQGSGSNRALRFLRASYWKRWWFKRRTKRIS